MPESAETKMLKEEKAERIAYFKKKALLRKTLSKLDWEKRGTMTGSRLYKYLKTDDVKKNFSQPLIDLGLEMVVDYDEPIQKGEIGGMTQHWLIKMTAGFVDIDTGYTDLHTYYGEAGDSGDKGVAKAKTMALKAWLTNEFLVIDGMDPDAEDETNVRSNSFAGSFAPKSKEAQTVAASKALDNAVAAVSKVPAAAPKTATVNVPQKIDKVVTKEETGNMPAKEPVKEEITAPAPAEPAADIPAPASRSGFKVLPANIAPLTGTYKKWVDAHNDKNISDVKFKEVTDAYIDIADQKAVMVFLNTYRVVKE